MTAPNTVPASSAPRVNPLQRLDVYKRQMLRHAVAALLADDRVSQVRVAVTPGDGWVDQAVAGLPRTVWRACGGATRADTVAGALADSGVPDDTWVLVHDAARPGLPAAALALSLIHI